MSVWQFNALVAAASEGSDKLSANEIDEIWTWLNEEDDNGKETSS